MSESGEHPIARSTDSCSPWYEVHDGDGPYLLLVHGMLSSRSHWLLNLDGLRAFSRPVVVELFGHGRSPSPADPACYHPDHYAAEFDRIREALGIERWLICGQSLGAALTFRYALEHPERVIAQAFTNSAAAFGSEEWSGTVRERMEEQQRLFAEEGRRAIEEHRLNPANNERFEPALREALAADVALHTPEGLGNTGRYTLTAASLRHRVAENPVPALLVTGERERRFLPDRAFVEEHVPHLDSVGLDGGHAVNIDCPRQFNEALRAFFTRFVE